jgi:hypothetical protein
MADFRKLGKGVTGALAQAKQLAAAEREANLQKMLEPSAVKMRLYHGTTATEGGKGQEAIRRLKPSKEGALGSGVYMTPNTPHASSYTGIPNDEALAMMSQGNDYTKKMADQFMADRAAGRLREGQAGGNMLPVYAQIKNPLIIGKSGRNIDPAADALMSLGMDEASAIRLVEKAFEEKGNIGKQIQSRAQAQGYDGIMQYRGDELSEVVSYNPNAVKSAIGNQGTYDLNSPDLSKADGGKIAKGAMGALKKAEHMAREAKRLKLGEILPKAEADENLRKMLDSSKIKERLYHATPEDIKFFKPGGLNPKISGEAVWLSNDPARTPAAHNIGYYDKPKEGVNVMPVHVQAKNPMILDDETMLKWAREVYGEGSSEFPYLMPKKWRDEVMKDYDSIVLADPFKRGDSHEIIMFEPEKIKSAIGNRGTYNTDTADITKADGGKIAKGITGALTKAQEIAKARKAADMAPTARINLPAPNILVPSKLNNVRELVRQSKGNYGARRVERAADEIPNLEKMYKEDALKEAFLGENASGVMTMNPADFEKFAIELSKRTSVGPKAAEMAKQGEIDKYTVPTDEYIKYLQQVGGFDYLPYLNLFKDEVGLPTKASIVGHEGRHRSRALADKGEKASLVQLSPRGDLREGMPRRTQEEFIESLKQELDSANRLVLPEVDGTYRRPPVELPDIYAEGGGVKHMADAGRVSRGVTGALTKAKEMAQAKKASESKMAQMLEAQQAPMTRPQGTGLPLMPRDQGMYTPREQKDLPRMPTVDKARAAGKSPKYNERMQDLLDSPTARKKVDSLINKGKDLDMKEWYGTEPLRQVAMDAGRTPEQFESLMAQLASASQRNPVDKQNQMGSYLYHLSETGQLPENSLLLTNKLKKALKEDPSLAEGRKLVELPKGYGSLAQGDIFNRAVMIGQGNIGEALPPNKKLGTFYENLLGNLQPVTVDVNAVRGPIIERGDPRWLTSKLVEKDETGKVTASYKPREMFDTGEMTMREAKQRPGFWEAAPSGSEYAGFEDLWQRGAKRHGVAPAEAQALGWYGSADVTALKTKPENYVDNLERLIKRTAEQTGKSPTEVMNDMVTGKGFLRKDGGAVKREESPEDMAKFHKRFAMHKAIGGRVSSQPAKRMSKGGSSDEPTAREVAEQLGKLAVDQGKEEYESFKKPRAATDIGNRGILAPALGLPVDMMNMGLSGVDALTGLMGKPTRLSSEKPFAGSEHIKDLMDRYGVTSGEDRPMTETMLSLFSPTGMIKGAQGMTKGAVKAADAMRRPRAGAMREKTN